MPYIQLTITREPRGDDYRRLLGIAQRWCPYALLVVRDRLGLDPDAQHLLTRLQGSLVEREKRSKWPGTELLGTTADVYLFRFNSEVISLLSDAVGGLYDWHQSNRPEDLCLLREGQDPWLVTIAHERDSYLVLTEEELAELSRELPDFAALLRLDE